MLINTEVTTFLADILTLKILSVILESKLKQNW